MKCLACGKSMPATGGPGRSASYCSPACKQAGYRASKLAVARAHATGEPLASGITAAIKSAVKDGMAAASGRTAQRADAATEMGRFGDLARLKAIATPASGAAKGSGDGRDAHGRARPEPAGTERDSAGRAVEKQQATGRDAFGRTRRERQ